MPGINESIVPDEAFQDLVARMRRGDHEATEVFVRTYEPLIRRAVRFKLMDERLRRVCDSMDLCQSVLASFLQRLSDGQFDLKEPNQIINLLTAMTRNKVIDLSRRQMANKRDHRRLGENLEPPVNLVDDRMQSPSAIVASEECIAIGCEMMTAEELQIARMRRDDKTWSEIALALGGTAQARRVQLSRVANRICCHLGLKSSTND